MTKDLRNPTPVPPGWHECEVVGSSVRDRRFITVELLLADPRHLGRTLSATLDTGRYGVGDIILRRMFNAANVQCHFNSNNLHHRAIELRLAIETGQFVIVDARSLTRGGSK